MMKALFSCIFILMVGELFSQPTITQAQFPLAEGDILTAYNQSYSAPSEGPAQTWDYTTLNISSPATVNVVNPSASSIVGLPTSSFCILSPPSPEDCYLLNASGMERTGLGGSGSSVPYQNPQLMFHFPITYGDSVIDTYHSDYNLGGFPGTRNGTTNIHVVGYGTLMLPGSISINNAMLVKAHDVSIDSTNVGSWSVVNFDFTTYYFYAAGYHGSILTMSSGTANPGGPVSTGNYYMLTSGAGIGMQDFSMNFRIYPIPAKDIITLTNNLNVDMVDYNYSIINIYGEVVRNGKMNSTNVSFDISDFDAGIYILNIYSEHIYASKRFIKH